MGATSELKVAGRLEPNLTTPFPSRLDLRLLFGHAGFHLFIGYRQVGNATYKELWRGKWMGDLKNTIISVSIPIKQ